MTSLHENTAGNDTGVTLAPTAIEKISALLSQEAPVNRRYTNKTKRWMRKLATVTIVSMLILGLLAPGSAACEPVATSAPPGTFRAAYVVFDRHTGTSTYFEPHRIFRMASLVKVIIALDQLQTTGGRFTPPSDRDRTLLRAMLRGSNNDAASGFWVRNGWDRIVVRWVNRMHLRDTRPPAQAGMWGFAVTSAFDMMRIYRFILHRAHPKARNIIMYNLRHARKYAADGCNQYFGIPRATDLPWAVKQGWSGFGTHPRPAMHTSGTVGKRNRKIVVVLTAHDAGTPYSQAARRITTLTRSALTYSRAATLLPSTRR